MRSRWHLEMMLYSMSRVARLSSHNGDREFARQAIERDRERDWRPNHRDWHRMSEIETRFYAEGDWRGVAT